MNFFTQADRNALNTRMKSDWVFISYFGLAAITMAVAIDNSVILESQQLHVIVDTRDGITRGQTIVDFYDNEKGNQNVRVVTKSDNEKLLNMLEGYVK